MMDKEKKLTKRYNEISERVKERGAILISSFDEFKERYKISKEDSRPLLLTFKCPQCGSSFDRMLSNIYRKDRSKKCGLCLKRDLEIKNLIKNQDKVSKLIQNKGLEIVDISDYKNEESPLRLICECGEIFITTYASIRNSSKNVRCKKCKGNKVRIKNRIPFNSIKRMYKEEGCILLSDEKEYVNIFSEMKFVAICGHIHTSTIQCFKNSKFKLCGNCSKNIHRGENAYNWKGGVYNNEKTKFRKTYEFKFWQIAVFKRDKHTCQCCGSKKNINAHHLDGYNWCKEKRTDIDNGITLCEECHKMFHHVYGYGNNTKDQYEEFIKGKGRKNTYNIVLN